MKFCDLPLYVYIFFFMGCELQEKYKEKKHKKDKDKEKKEGKEKKSKDRSKDKQKERKEKDKRKDRKDKEKDKEKSKPLEEKKAEVLTNTGHREKLVTNTLQTNSNGESKYVQDLARRIRYEEEATGSQSAQTINYPNQRNSGMTEKAFENSSFCPIQETNHREDDDKRINTQKNFAVAKSSENAVARVSFGADQKRADAMGKLKETRDQARQMESPEKSHRKESATKSDKSKEKEGVKKFEAKDKDRNKEKKEEKPESINKTRQEKPKLIGGPKLEEREKDSLDIKNCKPLPDLSRMSAKNLIAEGNLGKRKDPETNGFLYGELFPDPILCLVNEEGYRCVVAILTIVSIWFGT